MTHRRSDFAIPGAGFIASVTAASGIERTHDFTVAHLVLTHPGPRRNGESTEQVEAGMRALAAALDLGDRRGVPPLIGHRISVRRGVVTLDYGHDFVVMHIPPVGRAWVDLVAAGRPCRITLLVAPVPFAAGPSTVQQHLADQLPSGRVLWGTTYARRYP